MMHNNFINYLKNERHYSLETIKSYSHDVVQFFKLTDLEYDFLDKVDIEHIRLWIVLLKKKSLSAQSINRKISALKNFFNYCKREGVVKIDPFLKIKSLKEASRLPLVISEPILLDLFEKEGFFENNFEGIRDKLILELLYQTGIRLSELMSIKLSDYHCALRI